MKPYILAAGLSALVAAPLLACDGKMDGMQGKDTKASLGVHKATHQAHGKAKPAKTLASTDSKKEKI